ncbi:unnamed protein product [Moneuplotes crassus]|uniref:Uncharacterized protein n=1 Tax=Euplotes crassus TaxID=5936 RepID=A0AAD1X2W3_EUPCR|nr:unnamed protein product [Moneuplotes crassus]
MEEPTEEAPHQIIDTLEDIEAYEEDEPDFYKFGHDENGDLHKVSEQLGNPQMFEEIPEFFVDGNEERIQKNGTAKFQNLEQFLKDGEGDIELTSNEENQDPREISKSSHENPLSESCDDFGTNEIRDTVVSITKIPKIPIEKVQSRNNANSGFIVNRMVSDISPSYDPNVNINHPFENIGEKSDSDIFSTAKSIEFHSSRIGMRGNGNTSARRESDISQPFNRSRPNEHDDELLIESLMRNASQLQHVMKDYMGSERNDDITEREDRHELKEEISNMRDKIYRALEEYKDQVEKCIYKAEFIEETMKTDLKIQKEEIDSFSKIQNSQTDSVMHLNNFEEFLEVKSLEVENLESQIFNKDSETELLKKKYTDLYKKYELMIKSMSEKIKISNDEYSELLQIKKDLKSTLSKAQEKVNYKQAQVDEENKNIQEELKRIDEYNKKVEECERLKAENSEKSKVTKDIEENNIQIEDQIKLILQMNFDQTQNFDNLIVENKKFLDEMRKIAFQKRKEVYSSLDLLIRKHLNAANAKGVLGHKYITNAISEQKEQKQALQKQICKLEKTISSKREEIKDDKIYKEKLKASLSSKIKNQLIIIGCLIVVLLYVFYHKNI